MAERSNWTDRALENLLPSGDGPQFLRLVTGQPPHGDDYEAGYRDGGNSLIADIRHQFDDGADDMDGLLRFFRQLTGDPQLTWPYPTSSE